MALYPAIQVYLQRRAAQRGLCALLALTCATASFSLTGCGSAGYKGYKNAPYTVRGVRYYPLQVEGALGYREVGVASWYDEGGFLVFGRGTTALGEPYRSGAKAGAHKTLPLPCRVKVTNLENGRSTKIRINDRGPYIGGRMLDVTTSVARDLGFKEKGLTRVSLEVLSVGDGAYLVKSKRRGR